MGKKALIYGISGQDGHFLAQLLKSKGYSVAGVGRSARAAFEAPFAARDPAWGAWAERTPLDAYFQANTPPESLLEPIERFAPDEIYYLAAIHHQHITPLNAAEAFRVNTQTPVDILGHLKAHAPTTRFFLASSAYVYGLSPGPVDERSASAPNSLYAHTKLAAQAAVAWHRQAGLYACSGILFNHESPLRGPDFLPRKISRGVARIQKGLDTELRLGDLDARRDWGYAGDYVEAMWLMLQQKAPDDYVIATGESHSVREFCEAAFAHAGLDWTKHVKSDAALMRPERTTPPALPRKAQERLGWKPRTGFKELVGLLVDADIKMLERTSV